MDILFVSKYFVVVASMIMMLAALRASAYKSTTMGLLSSSVVVVAFALSLLVVGDMYDISFFKDISLALVLFGFIGTVAFAVTQGGRWLMFAVELIQSVLLIISAILMIISAIGFLTLDKNMNNLIYARIHIVGVFDVAFIIAMIGLQQYLLAGIYLVIAPFTAHAIANAFYNSEDKVNNLKNKEVEVESSDDENPFVHNINKVKEMENKSDESNDDSIKFSISTLEISEDE